jgi:putative transposase
MVVLETQPVAEGLQGARRTGLWSSYAHNAGVQQDSLVRSHAQYWALANTPFAREAAYQRTVEQGCRQPWRKRCWLRPAWRALGSPDFVAQLRRRPSGA